jgi:hypothetical protein
MKPIAIAVLSAALLAGPMAISHAEGTDSHLRLSGTLDIDQTRVAFLVSGNGGGGTLHFAGHDYPFSIGGLGIGGIGVSKIEATGQVYNMTATTQFTGMYSELRTGYALGDKGSGKLWLKNGDGVIIKLQAKAKGIALALGADAVHIAFKGRG